MSTDTINDVPSGSENLMLLRFIYDTSSVHDRLVQHTLDNGAAASESMKSKASADACPITGSIKPDDKDPKKRETGESRGK
ncbi:hypothetical protein NM208_g2513 [Fusarium decemcellulare]|uniref:Uncharacterized protein n=1 Tax=Fusarium decemcellulare TaxID=57161 RepID=A0ACC1SSD7_9HYPO|nr:hypothetical protein NM208_g2513 [Fusarium decemcellulare]